MEADTIFLCKNGHQNKASARFSADCGVSLKEPVSADRGKALEPAPAPEVDLESMNIGELREHAKQVGAKTARSKEDQIAAIREVSSKS